MSIQDTLWAAPPIDHEPAYTLSTPRPPPPPPPPLTPHPHRGFYHMVISGYLDHQSTQFRLSASELLLFVSVVLVLMKCTVSTIWNSKLRWPCLLATPLLWQKNHFHILFYWWNSLICCSFPFLFVLNVSLLLGTADAEILRSPLLKTQSRRMFSLKSTEQVRI